MTGADTMRALVAKRPGAGPRVESVPRPTPRAGELLLKVASCGVCATDLKIIEGALPDVSFPHVLGHEVCGVVVEVGPEGDHDFGVGDRVVSSMFGPCRSCPSCLVGLDQFCRVSSGQLGFTRAGGLAEFVAVPASGLLLAPRGVHSNESALLADCLSTARHAVEATRVRPTDAVVVIGAGGLGLHVLQFLALRTSRIMVVEPDGRRRAVALRVAGPPGSVVESLDALGSDADVDVVIECAGTSALPWSRLRPGARVGIVGYRPGAQMSLPQMTLVGQQISVLGIRASAEADLIAAARALQTRDVRGLVSTTMPLERAADALALLASGRVDGRAVVEIDPWTAEEAGAWVPRASC